MVRSILRKKTLSALLLLAIIIVILFLTLPKTFNLPNNGTQDITPDWYMNNTTTVTFTQQGKIKGILVSPKLTHYVKDNVIDISKPFLTLYDKSRIPWHITADHGMAYQGKNQRIDLSENVIIKQLPGKGSNQTTLTTSQLTYYPNTSKAHTDQPVTISQPGSTMHSVGFNANLKKGVINFLSKSQAEYDNVQQKK